MRLAVWLVTASCLTMAPQAQAQQAAQHAFAIPAGPLADALTSFGQQAGMQVSVHGDLVRGIASPGANGALTPGEALSRLLAGTGLTWRMNGNTVMLEKAPVTGNGVVQLGAVQVQGDTATGTGTPIARSSDPVASERTHAYTAPGVSIFKGTQTLKETPQAVTVITRQLMDDLNLNTIEQVMKQTPGITVINSPMGGSYFYSRGFSMSGQYQYDGVPLDIGSTYGQANSYGADMSYLDRVEVLRGAAGMMKGAGTPAGAVNFVRKRGSDTLESTVTLQAGLWNNYRAQLDVGGPLNASGTLRGRTVLAMQDRQFFYDVARRDDQIAYGALDYDIDPDTTLGVGIAYERLNATPCFGGLPMYSNGADITLPRSTCLGANWSRWKSERTTGYADLQHRFNANWTLKIAGLYSQNDQHIKYGWGYGGGTVTQGSTSSALISRSGLFDYNQGDYGADAYVDGKFHALGGEHEVILGGNLSHRRALDQFALIVLPETQNVFNPTHTFAEPADSYYTANAYTGSVTPGRTTISQEGLYGNLRLSLARPLKAVLGARVSWYKYRNTNYDYGSLSQTNMQSNGRFTPFAALLYDVTGNLTAYASYADIFQPQSNLDASGKVIQPKTGSNYEIGIKGAWMKGALNGSLNLFRADLNHAAAAISSTLCQASTSCSIDTGRVRAQGLEAELTGSPIDRMQVMLGYTYTETKVLGTLRDTSLVGLDGGVYNSIVPRHLLRSWVDYKLGGKAHRWSFGAGVTAQSATYRVTGGVRYNQGAYALVGARVAYDLTDRWNLSVNGSNLFDTSYYQTISSVVYYGEPRSFMVTLRGTY